MQLDRILEDTKLAEEEALLEAMLELLEEPGELLGDLVGTSPVTLVKDENES